MPGGALIAQLMLLAGASGQEFTQVQSLTNRVLFAKEDSAAELRAAERRRIQALDQRTQQQEILLEQQAQSVKLLDAQIKLLNDERQLLGIAEALDAAIAGGDVDGARPLLAGTVTIGVDGKSDAIPAILSSDQFLKSAFVSRGKGGMLPRFNQRVRVDGGHATLISSGFAWGQTTRPISNPNRRAGIYRYSFVLTPAGWKIDGLSFTSSIPSEADGT